ncbi:Amino-acid carrier protein AlsT, partial [Haemophilus influenzae]
LFRATLYQ